MDKYGWTEKSVNDNVINVYETADLSNYSEFDPKSIML